MHDAPYAIEMVNITKKFPGIVANDNVTLQLKQGEIHALLGENGAGKSTLMSVLFGLYQAEEGEIRKNGQVVKIQNPNDANALGIGMVHQHFKLVECFRCWIISFWAWRTAGVGFCSGKRPGKRSWPCLNGMA